MLRDIVSQLWVGSWLRVSMSGPYSPLIWFRRPLLLLTLLLGHFIPFGGVPVPSIGGNWPSSRHFVSFPLDLLWGDFRESCELLTSYLHRVFSTLFDVRKCRWEFRERIPFPFSREVSVFYDPLSWPVCSLIRRSDVSSLSLVQEGVKSSRPEVSFRVSMEVVEWWEVKRNTFFRVLELKFYKFHHYLS